MIMHDKSDFTQQYKTKGNSTEILKQTHIHMILQFKFNKIYENTKINDLTNLLMLLQYHLTGILHVINLSSF